jgi:putative hemolysin
MIDTLKLFANKIHKFEPSVFIKIERGAYTLKSVSSKSELAQLFKFRSDSLQIQSLSGNRSLIKSKFSDMIVDKFDKDADHLIIMDSKTRKIVCSVRLHACKTSSQLTFNSKFRTQSLFNQSGKIIELSRLSVAKNFPVSNIKTLLWRGIASYLIEKQAQFLVSSANIQTDSPKLAAIIYKYLQTENRIQEGLFCPPSVKYLMPQMDSWINFLRRSLTAEETGLAKELLSDYCRSMFGLGGLFGGEPAYNPDSKCIEFLTILPVENLNSNLWNRYHQNPYHYLQAAPLSAS